MPEMPEEVIKSKLGLVLGAGANEQNQPACWISFQEPRHQVSAHQPRGSSQKDRIGHISLHFDPLFLNNLIATVVPALRNSRLQA
jgi:hypothetical protein